MKLHSMNPHFSSLSCIFVAPIMMQSCLHIINKQCVVANSEGSPGLSVFFRTSHSFAINSHEGWLPNPYVFNLNPYIPADMMAHLSEIIFITSTQVGSPPVASEILDGGGNGPVSCSLGRCNTSTLLRAAGYLRQSNRKADGAINLRGRLFRRYVGVKFL